MTSAEGRPLKETIFAKVPNVRGETRISVFWAEGTVRAESGGSKQLDLEDSEHRQYALQRERDEQGEGAA